MKLVFLLSIVLFSLTSVANPIKPRVIVLADIGTDPDDHGSMVRFLTYSNEFDIEGLIATTSIHLLRNPRKDEIIRLITEYGKVRSNLLLHAPGFPSMPDLLTKVKSGAPEYGMQGVGAGKDNEGSNLIIEAVDQNDSRPVWVTIWGGANTLAQALHKVRSTRSPSQVAAFISKLRVYAIADQDDSGHWIRTNFPALFYIVSPGVAGDISQTYNGDTWTGMSGEGPPPRGYNFPCGEDYNLVTNAWLDVHVQSGHGPLGAAYPDYEWIMEGDTPSFLYLIQNGLGDPEHPEYGSWGGRYTKQGTIYTDSPDEVVGRMNGQTYIQDEATVWRWRLAYQNDFEARMDWNVKPYGQANHPPVPLVAGELHRTVTAGSAVYLSAAGSTDPDGNALSYKWFQYKEAGTYNGPITITGGTTQVASFTAPAVSAPVDIHIILEVADNGAPKLFRYKRVIVTILPATAQTPPPPSVSGDEVARTLAASHPLGSSEMVLSENGGDFVPYTGQINVGNVARHAGYWKFKVKAAPGRPESPLAASPAFTAPSTLPVVFSSFTVSYDRKNVYLNWSAQADDLFSHFVIERSTDGINYAEIGQLKASVSITGYSFTDAAVSSATGIAYYRIRCVEKTGEKSYSPIKTVRLAKEVTSLISIFPNPVANEANLTLPQSWQNKPVFVTVYSSTGVQVKTISIGSASQTEPVNFQQLPKGVYVIQAQCGDESFELRILKN